MTVPVPNQGNELNGLALVKTAYEMLAKALPGLGFGTEPSERVRKAMDLLAKVAPPGTATPGAQRAAQENFMMEQRQMSPLLAALAARSQGGGQAAPPAPPPAGGMA